MPISFAAITPHPPVIIPGIGSPDCLNLLGSTISSLEKLGKALEDTKPKTIILISPHAPSNPNSFSINNSPQIGGSFVKLGLHKYLEFTNDLELVESITKLANKKQVSCNLHISPLDQGALVPLYYLTHGWKPRIVLISLSNLNLATHYYYGRIIGKICEGDWRNIAIIASGDLSHRLSSSSPKGYSPIGKKFDKNLIKILKENEIEKIFDLKPEFIQEAEECGLKSIVILLGILNGKYNFELLSYEGSFGIGHLTARLM